MAGISFEFFPPKSTEAEEKLWRSVERLEPLAPDFVSVTYGAGGSTRDRTHACVRRLVDETGLQPAAHLTCVAASRTEVDEVVEAYAEAGVRHIVACAETCPIWAVSSRMLRAIKGQSSWWRLFRRAAGLKSW